MNKLEQKLMNTNFVKWVKLLCCAAVLIALFGGVLGTLTARALHAQDAAMGQTGQQVSQRGEHADDEQDGEQDCERDEKRDGERGERDEKHGDRDDEEEREDDEDGEWFDRVTTGTQTMFVALFVLCGALAAGLWLLLAGWLYKAAEQAGMNGVHWALLGLVGSVVMLFAFLIFRSFKLRGGSGKAPDHDDENLAS